jgi:hypothetical protein
MTHEHEWKLERADCNPNRDRTVDVCACGAVRYGCIAHRLDDWGEKAWGEVVVQTYRIVGKVQP